MVISETSVNCDNIDGFLLLMLVLMKWKSMFTTTITGISQCWDTIDIVGVNWITPTTADNFIDEVTAVEVVLGKSTDFCW